ncbi:Rrf2 family transcriptional regulator [Candidatus Fermentibacterales bacterium]|nr:Rrf2 family transcriptional regulator [Candidatus Fermentibacterales bacterium]
MSEAANLAIHAGALAAANEGPGYLSVKQMARVLEVSRSHLAKVLQGLARTGLMESVRGASGGYRLARPAEGISLLELLEAVDGRAGARACLLGRAICRRGQCVLGELSERVAEAVRDSLGQTSLAEFVRRQARK